MNFKDFYAWFLSGAVTLLVIVLGYFGGQSLDELRSIRKEMSSLNITMAVVVTNQTTHQDQINELKERVNKLEGRK